MITTRQRVYTAVGAFGLILLIWLVAFCPKAVAEEVTSADTQFLTDCAADPDNTSIDDITEGTKVRPEIKVQVYVDQSTVQRLIDGLNREYGPPNAAIQAALIGPLQLVVQDRSDFPAYLTVHDQKGCSIFNYPEQPSVDDADLKALIESLTGEGA